MGLLRRQRLHLLTMNMLTIDERGVVITCPQCGGRNRLAYDRLGESFRCGKCRTELPPPSEPIEARSESEFDMIIARAAVAVLVDFWAPWCGPCKMLAPELVKVAAEAAGHWLIVKVNTEDLPEVAQRFQVSAIPLLALFRNGREVARQSGARPAAAIRRFIEQTI